MVDPSEMKSKIDENQENKSKMIREIMKITKYFSDNVKDLHDFKENFLHWSESFISECESCNCIKMAALQCMSPSIYIQFILTFIFSFAILEFCRSAFSYESNASYLILGFSLYSSIVLIQIISLAWVQYYSQPSKYLSEVYRDVQHVHSVSRIFYHRLKTVQQTFNLDARLDEEFNFNTFDFSETKHTKFLRASVSLYNNQGIFLALLIFIICACCEFEMFDILLSGSVVLVLFSVIEKNIFCLLLLKKMTEKREKMCKNAEKFISWLNEKCEVKLMLQKRKTNILLIIPLKNFYVSNSFCYVNLITLIILCESVYHSDLLEYEFEVLVSTVVYGSHYILGNPSLSPVKFDLFPNQMYEIKTSVTNSFYNETEDVEAEENSEKTALNIEWFHTDSLRKKDLKISNLSFKENSTRETQQTNLFQNQTEDVGEKLKSEETALNIECFETNSLREKDLKIMNISFKEISTTGTPETISFQKETENVGVKHNSSEDSCLNIDCFEPISLREKDLENTNLSFAKNSTTETPETISFQNETENVGFKHNSSKDSDLNIDRFKPISLREKDLENTNLSFAKSSTTETPETISFQNETENVGFKHKSSEDSDLNIHRFETISLREKDLENTNLSFAKISTTETPETISFQNETENVGVKHNSSEDSCLNIDRFEPISLREKDLENTNLSFAKNPTTETPETISFQNETENVGFKHNSSEDSDLNIDRFEPISLREKDLENSNLSFAKISTTETPEIISFEYETENVGVKHNSSEDSGLNIDRFKAISLRERDLKIANLSFAEIFTKETPETLSFQNETENVGGKHNSSEESGLNIDHLGVISLRDENPIFMDLSLTESFKPETQKYPKSDEHNSYFFKPSLATYDSSTVMKSQDCELELKSSDLKDGSSSNKLSTSPNIDKNIIYSTSDEKTILSFSDIVHSCLDLNNTKNNETHADRDTESLTINNDESAERNLCSSLKLDDAKKAMVELLDSEKTDFISFMDIPGNDNKEIERQSMTTNQTFDYERDEVSNDSVDFPTSFLENVAQSVKTKKLNIGVSSVLDNNRCDTEEFVNISDFKLGAEKCLLNQSSDARKPVELYHDFVDFTRVLHETRAQNMVANYLNQSAENTDISSTSEQMRNKSESSLLETLNYTGQSEKSFLSTVTNTLEHEIRKLNSKKEKSLNLNEQGPEHNTNFLANSVNLHPMNKYTDKSFKSPQHAGKEHKSSHEINLLLLSNSLENLNFSTTLPSAYEKQSVFTNCNISQITSEENLSISPPIGLCLNSPMSLRPDDIDSKISCSLTVDTRNPEKDKTTKDNIQNVKEQKLLSSNENTVKKVKEDLSVPCSTRTERCFDTSLPLEDNDIDNGTSYSVVLDVNSLTNYPRPENHFQNETEQRLSSYDEFWNSQEKEIETYFPSQSISNEINNSQMNENICEGTAGLRRKTKYSDISENDFSQKNFNDHKTLSEQTNNAALPDENVKNILNAPPTGTKSETKGRCTIRRGRRYRKIPSKRQTKDNEHFDECSNNSQKIIVDSSINSENRSSCSVLAETSSTGKISATENNIQNDTEEKSSTFDDSTSKEKGKIFPTESTLNEVSHQITNLNVCEEKTNVRMIRDANYPNFPDKDSSQINFNHHTTLNKNTINTVLSEENAMDTLKKIPADAKIEKKGGTTVRRAKRYLKSNENELTQDKKNMLKFLNNPQKVSIDCDTKEKNQITESKTCDLREQEKTLSKFKAWETSTGSVHSESLANERQWHVPISHRTTENSTTGSPSASSINKFLVRRRDNKIYYRTRWNKTLKRGKCAQLSTCEDSESEKAQAKTFITPKKRQKRRYFCLWKYRMTLPNDQCVSEETLFEIVSKYLQDPFSSGEIDLDKISDYGKAEIGSTAEVTYYQCLKDRFQENEENEGNLKNEDFNKQPTYLSEMQRKWSSESERPPTGSSEDDNFHFHRSTSASDSTIPEKIEMSLNFSQDTSIDGAVAENMQSNVKEIFMDDSSVNSPQMSTEDLTRNTRNGETVWRSDLYFQRSEGDSSDYSTVLERKNDSGKNGGCSIQKESIAEPLEYHLKYDNLDVSILDSHYEHLTFRFVHENEDGCPLSNLKAWDTHSSHSSTDELLIPTEKMSQLHGHFSSTHLGDVHVINTNGHSCLTSGDRPVSGGNTKTKWQTASRAFQTNSKDDEYEAEKSLQGESSPASATDSNRNKDVHCVDLLGTEDTLTEKSCLFSEKLSTTGHDVMIDSKTDSFQNLKNISLKNRSHGNRILEQASDSVETRQEEANSKDFIFESNVLKIKYKPVCKYDFVTVSYRRKKGTTKMTFKSKEKKMYLKMSK